MLNARMRFNKKLQYYIFPIPKENMLPSVRQLLSKGNKAFVVKTPYVNKNIVEENAKMREENFQREKLQTGAELQRQKLLMRQILNTGNIISLQNRDELAQIEKQREREIAKAEADRQMKLTQQLAVEKQRVVIL